MSATGGPQDRAQVLWAVSGWACCQRACRLAGRVLSVPGPAVPVRGGQCGEGPVAEQPGLSFGALLRQLRDDAGLTQEELAEAASLSPRSVSDLERGVNLTARHDTARLLAGALGLSGSRRARFEAAARGRVPADQVLAAGEGGLGTLPRPLTSFVGRQRELAEARRLLESSRLLTVTGPGGGGKTRLCIELAAAVAADYPD